jgi:bifunctional DNA-binding transcriptional regulator/antitoxin component of YhaV-PrlF toxin-antitoxin module
MSRLPVNAKGQVTLSRDMLTHLGIHPGDNVVVDKLPHGRIEIRAVRPTGRISDVFDFLKKKDGRSLSIEDMNKIGTAGTGDKNDR